MKGVHISTATTTVVKSNPGLLHTVVINTTSAGTITLYDNASAATGNVIAVIKGSVLEGSFFYDTEFVNGLVVVTAGASDITVTVGASGSDI